MSAIRKEATKYFNSISDKNLKVLTPLLKTLAEKEDDFIIETDLTEEEIAIIAQGEELYKKDPSQYVPFDFD